MKKQYEEDPTTEDDRCRVGQRNSDTKQHIIGACENLTAIKHDSVAKVIHSLVIRKYKFQ